jgi:hypothetical protein
MRLFWLSGLALSEWDHVLDRPYLDSYALLSSAEFGLSGLSAAFSLTRVRRFADGGK